MPKCSIIVVSYNTKDITLECVRSIYSACADTDFELIVVDNLSSDGSADAIEKQFPQVRLIRPGLNLGFSKANNLAVREAAGGYILLLNPDTIVRDKAVDRLIAFADRHSSAGIWGGRTTFADGSLNPTSCWGFMSLWSLFCGASGLAALWRNSSLFNPEGYGNWQRDSVRQVDIVSGCFFLIQRDLWQQLNGFDETFFMYAEEADLCFRARQLRARPVFTPDATIVHYGGASEKVYSAKVTRLFSGKIRFIKKHWSRPAQFIAVGLFKWHVITRLFAYATLSIVQKAERHKISAREWQQVWKNRREWEGGYLP